MLGLALLCPLIGFSINGLLGARIKNSTLSGIIATSSVFIPFLIFVAQFLSLQSLEQKVIEQTVFQWIQFSNFQIPFSLKFDPLSGLLCLIITGVGALIHLYSMGYMSHDRTPAKFFAYLNLFTFSMLILVLGANLPLMFMGWEGVGLCSYLLIGYWYEDDAKASAGKKAFIVNRVGDFGFLVGIFLIYSLFQTLDFTEIQKLVKTNEATLPVSILTITTFCLFVGAMGKSAQIPLYVWLPDAMAGPTPVSALIHAATMVTAGVYMIVRLNFLYALTPTTLAIISAVGALTALFAATIGLVQRDIKKVLAYSTVSQLGFMFAAVGVGAYAAGIFHLMTHAFFKALLFLGSGSVIHGMHEEQDIFKMGGLKNEMPRTYLTFLMGTLAISGFPLTSGFFSKDEILWNAFSSHVGAGGVVLWAVLSLAAFCTAFYMTRLLCLTFLGSPRYDKHELHPHESPLVMTGPLFVLAFLSLTAGFLGFPGHSWIAHWSSPVIGEHHGEHGAMAYVIMGISILVSFAGMGLGYWMYVLKPSTAQELQAKLQGVYRLLLNKYYVDELYEIILLRPIQKCAELTWKFIDVVCIDGFVVGWARLARFSGEKLRLIQSGSVHAYALFSLIGLITLVGFIVYVHKF